MADVELDVTFESSTVNLDTDFGTVYVLDGNVAVKIIADNYSNTSTYLVGAYVIYEGLLYRCITEIDEPEEFNPVKWKQVKLANEVDDIRKVLSNKADIASLSEVATSGSYTDLTNKPTIPDAQVNSDWNAETGVSVILNKPSIYTQSQVDAIAVLKADKSNTYTKSQVDSLIDNLPNPMIFKGTLGENGTITSLPNASASNVGHTYKVITAGTYAGQEAKVGDTFTSAKPVGASGYSWILFSEGDTDTDTWRNIKVNGTEVLGNGISSGSADFIGSDNIDVEFDSNGNKIGIKTKNIYTKTEVDNIVYNILPNDTASGASVEFNTSLVLPLKSIEIDVSATQASGTPTPANPLPISGVSEIDVTHNEEITTIQLGDTYFGGTLIQNGKHRQFRATHKIFDFGDGYIGGYGNISGAQVFMTTGARSDIKIGTFAGMCSCYKAVNKDGWHLSNYEMSLNNKDPIGTYIDGIIYFRNDDYTQAQAEELKQAMTGQKIVYELATPVIIDLPDGDTISTVSGANTISAGGKTMRVAFKCSIEEYINAHSS